MRAPTRLFGPLALLFLLATATGCVSTSRQRRTNVLEYLYPEGKEAAPGDLVRLSPPVNVGVAFVPETDPGHAILPDEKQSLLETVKEAFDGTEGLGRIEVVPEGLMSPRGGFEDLHRLRRALGIDLIALVSYDQTQFDDPNLASITYWTIAGAYVIPGNENETHTLVQTTVFDIDSEALLFNASGQSHVEGRATAMKVEEALREDRLQGFEGAVGDMIVGLRGALDAFREQIREGTVRGPGTPEVKVVGASVQSGGTGAGALGPLELLLGLLLLAGVFADRSR